MEDEELARKSAYILGESSAAAKALAELDARRRDGEPVAIYNYRGSWLVGPYFERPSSDPK